MFPLSVLGRLDEDDDDETEDPAENSPETCSPGSASHPRTIPKAKVRPKAGGPTPTSAPQNPERLRSRGVLLWALHQIEHLCQKSTGLAFKPPDSSALLDSWKDHDNRLAQLLAFQRYLGQLTEELYAYLETKADERGFVDAIKESFNCLIVNLLWSVDADRAYYLPQAYNVTLQNKDGTITYQPASFYALQATLRLPFTTDAPSGVLTAVLGQRTVAEARALANSWDPEHTMQLHTRQNDVAVLLILDEQSQTHALFAFIYKGALCTVRVSVRGFLLLIIVNLFDAADTKKSHKELRIYLQQLLFESKTVMEAQKGTHSLLNVAASSLMHADICLAVGVFRKQVVFLPSREQERGGHKQVLALPFCPSIEPPIPGSHPYLEGLQDGWDLCHQGDTPRHMEITVAKKIKGSTPRLYKLL